MRTETFIRRVHIPAPATEVFHWHARPGAFERLTPPWESVEIIERRGGIENGGRVVLRMGLGLFSRQWIAEHCDYEAGVQFRDVQISGPFTHWEHTHRVEADGREGCMLEDRIEYALPGGSLGRVLGGAWTRQKLERLFTYRHAVTRQDVLAHDTRRNQLNYGGRPMKVLVSGASGLVGSALIPFLTTGGHSVTRLVRKDGASGGDGEVVWAPAAGTIDQAGLEGFDAIVHLAGENIAAGRWTPERKRRIRDSRVKGTRLLCEALTQCAQPPKVFVGASAIGYYGDRGDETLNEESGAGEGFLAEVCRDWEAATAGLTDAGIRTALLRVGIVLSPAGGALKKMLLPFQLGLGGVIGAGSQYMSCIALDDVIGVIQYAITSDEVSGPINAVCPEAVTNQEYTRTLGTVLGRPTFFPVPAFAARFVFGEMADTLLLASTRVEPRILLRTGYEFRYPQLENALRHVLGKEAGTGRPE